MGYRSNNKSENSNRPTELSEEFSYQIKKELKESNNQGWTAKQVEKELIKWNKI
jgi:hypothetical protein